MLIVNPFFSFCRFIINHTKAKGEYAIILETGAVKDT
jgi:hypothetical protein